MQNPDGFIQQQNPWAPANWMNPGNRPQDSQSGGGYGPGGMQGGANMPPVKPGMLPNKPMEAPPPDKSRLTGRRG
jgi:hypothetical protein